jgi:hypothetical protein
MNTRLAARRPKRDATETATQPLVTLIGRLVMNACHAKSNEGSPWRSVHHLLNRSVGRMHVFRKAADLEAFERVMVEAHQRQPIRNLAYCILSNHWHLRAMSTCCRCSVMPSEMLCQRAWSRERNCGGRVVYGRGRAAATRR